MQAIISSVIARHGMLRYGTRIGVAVSGGADSVFLLHLMKELGLAAAVLHVNHKLRGEESDEDEEFVRDLAGAFRLPVFVENAPVPQDGNLEQEARRLRYSFFSRLVDSGEIDAIATGHTLDDQAETVLSRFLRGSGTAGLAGIQPVTQERTIRPLLDIPRQDVRDYLLRRSIAWRDDTTNGDLKFLRNRIRLEVLPALEKVASPALSRILAGTAEWARAEEDFWQGEVNRLSNLHFQIENESVIFSCKCVNEMPVAFQRRLVRRAIELVRGNLRSVDFAHVEAVRDLMQSTEGSGRIQVPGVDVLRSFASIRFSPIGFDSRLNRNFSLPVEIPAKIELPERGLFLSLEPVRNEAVYNNQVNALDGDRCAGTLSLRNWRPGDLFHRQGHSGLEKIKSLFQDFRIPLWERRGWPVITVRRVDHLSESGGEHIIWTRQFGVASGYAADARSASVFLVRETAPQVTESKRISPASIEVKRAPGFGSRPSGEPGAEVL